MINRLVVSNLRHRPIRTGLSILAVAMEVAMMLLIVGVAEGLLEDSHGRTRSVGADILIRPSGSDVATGLGNADIPEAITTFLPERYGEIEMALGTTLMPQEEMQTITGVDWGSFVRMCGGIHYFSGGPPQGPYDVVVDEIYSRYKKVEAGDTLKLLNQDFHVAGVVETGKMSRIFIPIKTMQELLGWEGKFSQVFIKLRNREDTPRIVKEISGLLPANPVYDIEEFLSLAAADVREVSSQFTDAIVGIAVVIGFLVVLLSMYTSILERTREIGILKSLGATNGFIVTILLREVIVLCVVGIALGVVLSYVVREGVKIGFPLFPILISGDWIAWSALLAVLGALVGALYPAIRAARQDPIDALTYD
ncbi:MAG: ABC transporter permease [Acidobacteria bacterium]|nr:ABC transporter permease [Acidobacteriota bacterium]